MFNEKYKVGNLVDRQTKYLDLNYKARYYQYERTISAGEVNFKMVSILPMIKILYIKFIAKTIS